MGGIEQLAETVATDMEQRLPGQRKTQRGKLALLVATMLEVRSANLMDVAACLPRPAERLDSRYQWIKRFLANARVVSDAVMAPYGREVLARLHRPDQGERAPSGRDGGGAPGRPRTAAGLAGEGDPGRDRLCRAARGA